MTENNIMIKTRHMPVYQEETLSNLQTKKTPADADMYISAKQFTLNTTAASTISCEQSI